MMSRWTLMPRLSGFPRDYAAAAIPTRAAALSADCLVMSRALLEEMGGPADDYLLAHFACADLCLQARALGREVGRLPEPAFSHRRARPAGGRSSSCGVRRNGSAQPRATVARASW